MSSVTLRIVHVNDVYLLNQFPSLSTLFQESKKGAQTCLLTLGGDFVAPSLLSGLDAGKGMIEVCNATGVTHVCFGNHEADVSLSDLLLRIQEFKGVWINSNMPGFPLKLPFYDIVKISSPDGSHKRSVALIGLLCHYPTLFLKNAFGGAVPSIIPVNDSAISWKEKLQPEVDLVIPMTHQDLSDDRILAKKNVFPLILGGHDHEEYYEKHEDSLLIKAGVDAFKAAVIDITWQSPSDKNPQISYAVKTVSSYAPDPNIQTLAKKHLLKLEALNAAVIYRHNGPQLLSSKGTRLRQTTMGDLLCGAIRRVLKIDAVFINAGGIRGNSDYTNKQFTLSDLRKEIQFETPILVCSMKGEDLVPIVQFSRTKTGEYGGFLQSDDLLRTDSSQTVTQINGKPLDSSATYRVGLVDSALGGMDNITPLVEWAKKNPSSIPQPDSAIPAKTLVLSYFMKLLWSQLPSFDQMDTNKNGKLSVEEVSSAYSKLFSPDLDSDNKISEVEQAALDSIVEKLISCLNIDEDGAIDRKEYEAGLGILSKAQRKKIKRKARKAAAHLGKK